MVSTVDSESTDPGSIPGKTCESSLQHNGENIFLHIFLPFFWIL
jgi:hypothetical protein